MSETPKHDYDDLFKALGETTIVWAYLETAVTMLSDAIWHRWGGKDIGEAYPRTALSRKTDLIGDWYESAPKWRELFPDLDKVIKHVVDASEHRHQLIHGIAENLESFPDTGIARMVRDVKRTEHRITRAGMDMTVANITEFRSYVLKLTLVVVDIAAIFRGEDPDDEGGKALRETLGRLS